MSALIFFFIFGLNAEQPKTQKYQEAGKTNPISENPASLNQKTNSVSENPASLNQKTNSVLKNPASLNQKTNSVLENPASLNQKNNSVLENPASLNQKNNSVLENPASLNQKNNLNTDTQVKTNEKNPSASKTNTSQKSNKTLSDKETSSLPESNIYRSGLKIQALIEEKKPKNSNKISIIQESFSSADNKEKGPSPSTANNIEKKSPSQSIQSIDSETPLLFENSENKEPPFSIELEAEGSLIKNPLSKNQKGFYPHIPYIELSFKHNTSSNLQFFTELEFDSIQNSWGIELEQAGLLYHSNLFDLKVGRIPVSLGYSYANSNLFVKPLSLYKLFRANPMDIGLRLTVPLYKKYLNLSVSRFKGHLKRAFDNFHKPPEFAPMTITLKNKGPAWNGFITYLKQDLAFQEPLNALGGGFTFKTSAIPEFFLQGEVWGIGEKLQNSFSYCLFPKLSFNKYEWGVLFGEIKNFAPNFKNTEAKSSIYEWILQGSYELFPGIFLVGERFITKQKKGPLINDIWALRLKTKLEF